MVRNWGEDFENGIYRFVFDRAENDLRLFAWKLEIPGVDESLGGVGIVSRVEDEVFSDGLEATGPLDLCQGGVDDFVIK